MRKKKPTTKICVHSGHQTIGGTKISLIGGNEKGVLLDFGWNFATSNLFLDEFMKLRKHVELFDALELGEIPFPYGFLQGLYREDYINHHPNDAINYKIKSGTPKTISAVLLSHGHADHTGCIKYLHPSIPLITGPITHILMNHLDDVKSAISIHKNIINYKNFNDIIINREIKEIVENIPLMCAEDGIEVNFFETDHSLPGAGAFLITDKITGIKIVYTGDIRFHGPRSKNAFDFLSKAKDFSPDILICEGTRIDQDEIPEEIISEQVIQENLTDLFEKYNKEKGSHLILFDCAENDIWRLNSFYNAAISNNRILILNSSQYLLLQKLVAKNYLDDIDFTKIKVYLPRKDNCQYIPQDYVRSKSISKLFKKPESEIPIILYKSGTKKGTPKPPALHKTIKLEQTFTIKAETIRNNPENYVIYLPFYNMNEMLDISPPGNSYYIISKSEPFDDEMVIDERKRLNWLEHYGIFDDGEHIVRIHCSGHANRTDLFSMINTISPRFLIPVHTNNPKEFANGKINSKISIIFPEREEIYEFS